MRGKTQDPGSRTKIEPGAPARYFKSQDGGNWFVVDAPSKENELVPGPPAKGLLRESYLDSSTSRWLSFCVGRLSCGYSFVKVANCSLERLDVDFKMYQVTPSVQGGVVSEPL
jgi:hypothetical protein